MGKAKDENLRKFGLEIIGNIPWGTHLCQFYETRKDLTDILVPYFAEGLRNNEFCMWITSPPLEGKEAKEALRKAVPDLDLYLEKGQIEMLSYDDWYVLDGEFDADRVLQGWVKKEKDALSRGFEGLRLTGNTFWVERKDWRSFTDYEASINDVIGAHRMIALCTYSLKKCNSSDVVDVIRNHAGTLVRKGKKWYLVEDVTERKKVENGLRREKGFSELVVNSSVDGILAFDRECRYTMWNEGMERISGFKKEDVLGKNAFKVFPFLRKTGEDGYMLETLQGKTAIVKDRPYRVSATGREGFFDGSYSPLLDTSGKVVGGLAIIHDVTDRKLAEEKLLKSEKNYRNLVDALAEGVWAFDENGKTTFVNPQMAKMLGYSAEEMQGKLLFDFMDEHGKKMAREAKSEHGQIERDFVRKDGSRIQALITTSPLTDENGKIAGAIASVIDITQRKNMERALLNSEHKYRSLFSSMKAGFAYHKIILNADGIPADYLFLEANEAFRRLTGLDKEVFMGRRVTEVFPNAEEDLAPLVKIYGEVAMTGKSKQFETFFAPLKKWFSISVYSPSRGYLAVTFDDITERKQTEEEVENIAKFPSENPDPVIRITKNGTIVYCNPAGMSLLKDWKREVGQLAPEHWCRLVTETLQDGVRKEFEEKLGEAAFSFLLVPLTEYVNVYGLDITESKKIEERLFESEKKYRTLYETMADGTVKVDMEGHILECNEAYANMLGYSKEELQGFDFRQLAPEKWRQMEEEILENQVLSRGFSDIYEMQYVRKDGTVFPVSIRVWLSRDESGEPQGMWALVRDITDRKKTENELREARDYLNNLLNCANAPIIVWNPDFKITMFNHAFERLTGMSSNDVIGKKLDMLFPNDKKEEAMDHIRRVLLGEYWEAVEIPVLHADGTFSIVLWNSANIHDSSGKQITATIAQGQDITERKRAEKELKKSEEVARQRAEELEKIMDMVPNALWISHDPECRVVKGNRAANQFYEAKLGDNVSAGPATGGEQDHTRRFFQNGRELKSEELPMQEAAVKNVEIRDSEVDVLLPSGKKITILGSATPLKDAEGKVRGCVASFMDITERKKAEEALRESQLDLNRAQAVAKIGSWRLDVQHDNLLWSDETYRIFGIPKGTPLTYETFLSYVHSEDRVYVDQKWKAALRGEPYDIEHRIIANGEAKWVREKAELELDGNGTLRGGFGTVQEITELKRAEQALQRAKIEWERTFDNIPDLIAILDGQHKIMRANRSMARKLGVTPEQCVGLTCFECVHGTRNPPEFCPHSQTMHDGQEHTMEVHEDRLDGDFLVSTTPLKDEQGQIVGSVHVARNITERKKLAERLEQYTKHLEQLVEERTRKLKDAERLATIGEVAGMVGHDIRNPLQTIEGALFLVKGELESMPPETEQTATLKEMISTIQEESGYIDKIVSDLQDYARQLTPKLEQLDFEQLVAKTIMSMPVPENIETSITIEDKCRNMMADFTMMKRIVTNLITNAIQAMPNGGRLIIRAVETQGKAEITIQDSGEGIPDEMKSKMFQPLFSTKAKGQGFGLAVVKRLVEGLKGQIAFESEVGKGTTFTITIPLKQETNQ